MKKIGIILLTAILMVITPASSCCTFGSCNI